ncbi:MAG: hypothetical protein M3N46_13145 [Actinomycetota bacterium]|nr:hypothetical protein [Actinomycetota bacterium]
MELLERTTPLPLIVSHPGLTVLALHGRLTRVTRRDGAVLGYVERVDPGPSNRERPFLAKRLRPRALGFLEVGRFWSADEAVEALR